MANKYHAKPTEIDGIRFASKAEAKRYRELKNLQTAGEIFELSLQPSFKFYLNGIPMRYVGTPSRKGTEITYIADFAYHKNGIWVVEDVKGVETPLFKLKRALMKTINDIEVVVVK